MHQLGAGECASDFLDHVADVATAVSAIGNRVPDSANACSDVPATSFDAAVSRSRVLDTTLDSVERWSDRREPTAELVTAFSDVAGRSPEDGCISTASIACAHNASPC